MTRRTWMLFSAMCIIWGIPYLLIRVAVRDVSPPALVFARTFLGALVLLPIALKRNAIRPVLPLWRPLLAFTAIEIAIPWLLLNDAETKLSSSLTGLLIAAVPLVGVVIARFGRTKERVDATRLAGLLLGVVGVVALLGLDLGNVQARPLLEVGVVVVGYAVAPVILNRHLGGVPGIGVVFTSLAITSLAYLPAAVVMRPDHLHANTVASIIALALICTALAFVLFFELIAAIGPSRAVVITYVNPAVAVFLGVLLLNESFTMGMAIGFPLILAGSVLAARTRKSRDEVAIGIAEPVPAAGA
ncbi:drug/metabolite transporter (DMT)-like permease [Jatrophihabitans sp. GAS493]|uniref:DMT family transporter n=1 Tax=Jatrophihabitans sp. GAS493 TaxID=1907575 RepID=UPI000BB9A297|nr:DMT family transporter [Jatrophihabitans sp. GAS493]SOD74114.1 drug/metabolite transporter (DMT)-like permease [Jatrophihabitans sp. GAS493]